MISVLNVTKHFDEVHALSEVDLDIATGEFITIVGPSGCGKSTLLRIIAGLINSTEGSVNKPDTSMGAFVFQDAALLPWRNVQKNVELLMELESGFSKSERDMKAHDVLNQVGLEGFEKSYPHQLSGGMKMRLSLARSLVLKPDYLLLDEPLSAVDELTREVLQEEIHTLWKEEKFTSILVTHNVTEAVYLSNRVVVMSPRPGKITHIVDIPFKKRDQKLRSSTKFHKLVSDISGKLREWK
jgi:NitT/TauT family transport system ATP-binding protein|tara:strand:+ start:979 stop:1701 length:723 start_codon:yes stop_codon:yes gene_type:complete